MDIDAQAGSSPEVIEQQVEDQQPIADSGESEDSLLSVLRSAVDDTAKGSEESQADTPSAQGQEGEQAQDNQSDAAAPEIDLDAQEMERYPSKIKKRFKQLLSERHEWRSKAQEYEPDAQQYREIQSFMQRAGLSAEEVAEGLLLMAEMKSGDPIKAHEALMKKVETLALAAGKKLPADLEEKVEQGYIDREVAQQLHQQRVQAERQAAIAQQQLAQRQQQEAIGAQQAMANAVAAWEQATRQTDPDFDLKADLVKDRLRAHMAVHGMPRSTDEALALSRQAYEAVSQTLQRARGTKPAMRPAVGGKVSGSVAPEPKNLLDVIRRASAAA